MKKTGQALSAAPAAGQFPNTGSLWSGVIGVIGQGDPVKEEAALARLCQLYWYPIYAYLRRQFDRVERNSFSHQRAEDYTQGFFAHLIEKNTVARARREKGRFRSFLLGSLGYYVKNEQSREQAGKRGGGNVGVPLGGELPFDPEEAEKRYQSEPADDTDPAKLFERRWAMELLTRVLTQLEVEYAEKGRGEVFTRLEPLLQERTVKESYAEIADAGGMTKDAVKKEVSRLRARYRELFTEEINHTLNDPGEADDEIRHLFRVLQG